MVANWGLDIPGQGSLPGELISSDRAATVVPGGPAQLPRDCAWMPLCGLRRGTRPKSRCVRVGNIELGENICSPVPNRK
jgi:hypothetical protein